LPENLAWHNIGNILNSACTSNSILSEKLQQPYLKKLFSVSEIIKKHLSLQDDYLTHHPKGKKIPDYLIALIEALIEESEETAEEIKNIDMHLNHIKEIVILQNEFSGISGLKEKFLLSDVIDLSIQMSSTKKIIHIIKDYKYDEPMMTDKSKLLQIIINLFRNAKDSVILSTQDNKNITISTTKINNNTVEIRIIDNGLGIPKENLTKIFSFGYTTKRNKRIRRQP
jgi:phosphoglycerate-specific signal transduction histidine kinase